MKKEVFEDESIQFTEFPMITECEVRLFDIKDMIKPKKEEEQSDDDANFYDTVDLPENEVSDDEPPDKTDNDNRDREYLPRSVEIALEAKRRRDAFVAKQASKPKVAGTPRYTKKEVRRRKKLWDADSKKISDAVEVKCYLCEIPFETWFMLAKHFRSEHPQFRRPFLKCCGRIFRARYKVLEHVESHGRKSPTRLRYLCDLCPNTGYISKKSLSYHMNLLHSGSNLPPVKCTICDSEHRNEFALKHHMKRHQVLDKAPKKTFECYMCHRSYRDLERLRSHNLMHAFTEKIEKENIVCEICSKVFIPERRKDFKKHLEYHKEQDIIAQGNGVRCSQCPKVFGSQSKLTRHIESIHNTNRQTLICEICSKELKSNYSLMGHIRAVHGTGDEPRIPCQLCGHSFKSEYSWRKHMRVHRDNSKEFACKECGHRSKSRNALWSHVNFKHRLKRTLACRFCPKMLKLELDRKEHEATHTGIDLYSCEFCDKTFKFGASYRGHRKREHPMEYEQNKPKWMKQ